MSAFHSVSYIIREAKKRKLFTYASSCSFYLFMSLIPLSMILCSLLKFTPVTETVLISYVDTIFSASVSSLFRGIIVSIYNSGGAALTVSILLCLYSASGCVRALMEGLDAAYDFVRRESILKYYLRAILYLLFLLLTILVSLGLMIAGPYIAGLLRKSLPMYPVLHFLLSHGRLIFTAIAEFIIFLLLYKMIPAENVKIREQIPGALFSTVIWILFSLIFSGYLSISNRYGAYGLIGTVMITMLWFYYSILILLIGGFINSFTCNTYRHKSKWSMPFPEDLFRPN